MDMETIAKTTSSTRSSIPKKLSNILRVLLIMVKKGISKSKLGMELNLMLKRGNRLAGKTIGNLLTLNLHRHHHHHHMSFSNDAVQSSFKDDNEYEFNSSNSLHNYRHLFFQPGIPGGRKNTDNNQLEEDAATVAAVQRVLEMLDKKDVSTTTSSIAAPISPMVHSTATLPYVGRQLRITDSPFPLEDRVSSAKVNEAADDFIKKFYTNLLKQTPK